MSIVLKLATSNNSICLTFTRCAKRVERCIEQHSQLLALFAVKAIGLQIALKATRIDALDFVECFIHRFSKEFAIRFLGYVTVEKAFNSSPQYSLCGTLLWES